VNSETPRPRGYETVQSQIRDLVRESGLRPGERLPSERQLAQELGVGRNSLREALMVLRVEGLIDIQHGSGAYLLRSADDVVAPITADLRLTHPTLPALGEVRNALETLATQLAAVRREDGDLEEMVAANRQMQQEIQAGESGIAGDRRFHRAILEAAHNSVLVEFYAALATSAEVIAGASLAREGQPPRSLATHRLIFEAVAGRDPERANALMREHLGLTGQIGLQLDSEIDSAAPAEGVRAPGAPSVPD
jgi:GntR family transcriptional repressor for pyruvate dehydrogenase complex